MTFSSANSFHLLAYVFQEVVVGLGQILHLFNQFLGTLRDRKNKKGELLI